MEYHTLPAGTTPGSIRLANAAVEQLVAHTAAECYGVVGLGTRGGRVGRMIAKARPTTAVAVRDAGEGLAVELDVVVEHGLNLAEVASTVRSHVAYEVERSTGLHVASVDVRIGAVRRSA